MRPGARAYRASRGCIARLERGPTRAARAYRLGVQPADRLAARVGLASGPRRGGGPEWRREVRARSAGGYRCFGAYRPALERRRIRAFRAPRPRRAWFTNTRIGM